MYDTIQYSEYINNYMFLYVKHFLEKDRIFGANLAYNISHDLNFFYQIFPSYLL